MQNIRPDSGNQPDQTLNVINRIQSTEEFLRARVREFARVHATDFDLSESELTKLTQFLDAFFSTSRDRHLVKNTPEHILEYHREVDSGLKDAFDLSLKLLANPKFEDFSDKLNSLLGQIAAANMPERHQRGLRNAPQCNPKDEEECAWVNALHTSSRETNSEQPFLIKFVAQASSLLSYKHDKWTFFGFLFQYFYPKYKQELPIALGEVLRNRLHQKAKSW